MIVIESTFWPLVVVGAVPDGARDDHGPLEDGLWASADLRLAVVIAGEHARGTAAQEEVFAWLSRHRDRLSRSVSRVAWIYRPPRAAAPRRRMADVVRRPPIQRRIDDLPVGASGGGVAVSRGLCFSGRIASPVGPAARPGSDSATTGVGLTGVQFGYVPYHPNPVVRGGRLRYRRGGAACTGAAHVWRLPTVKDPLG